MSRINEENQRMELDKVTTGNRGSDVNMDMIREAGRNSVAPVDLRNNRGNSLGLAPTRSIEKELSRNRLNSNSNSNAVANIDVQKIMAPDMENSN